MCAYAFLVDVIINYLHLMVTTFTSQSFIKSGYNPPLLVNVKLKCDDFPLEFLDLRYSFRI